MPAYRCSRIGARVGPGEFRGLGVAGGGYLHWDGAKTAVRLIIMATGGFFNRGLAHPRRAPGILDLYGWPPGGSGSLETCPRCCRGRLPGGRRCCGTSPLLIKCWPSFRRRTIASPVRPVRLPRTGQSRPFRFRRGLAPKAAGRRRAEPAKSAAAACSAIDP